MEAYLDWLKTCSIAESFNIEVSTHFFLFSSSNVSIPTAEWLEWVYYNPILQEPYKIKNGNIIIPNKPGFGIEWDDAAISKYNIDIL